MAPLRTLLLPLLAVLLLAYVAMLWWASQTGDDYARAQTDFSGANHQEMANPATTKSAQQSQGPVARSIIPQLDETNLHVATLLLLLAVAGIVAFLIRMRSTTAVRPSTTAAGIASPPTWAEPLFEQVEQQQRQLEALHSAVTELISEKPESPPGDEPTGQVPGNENATAFVAQLSHELRTPLHGILGHAQNLRRDDQTHPDSLPRLQAIESCGQALLRFINDLIDFTRLEAGKLELNHQPCQLQQIIEGAAETLRAHAGEKQIDLRIETTPNPLPWVISDSLRLRQLITRLVISAIDHPATESGVIKLQLRLTDGHLMASVKGQAQRPGQQAARFATHSAENNAEADLEDLGLAVASRLVALFGGEMLSDVSTGDCTARIPCELAAEQLAAPAIETTALALGNGTTRPSAPREPTAEATCRLMIVDKEEPERARVAHLLAGFDCTVEQQPSIERASQRLQDEIYDLVLVATGEPSPKAQDRASELRLVAAGEPKVVAFSNTPHPDELEKIGFDAVLSKPIKSSQLIKVLDDLLHTSTRHAAGTTEEEAISPWPQPLGRETAARITAALDGGDVDSLLELAAHLGEQPGTDPATIQRLTQLAKRFDFSALRQLAEQLSVGPTGAPPDA